MPPRLIENAALPEKQSVEQDRYDTMLTRLLSKL